MSKKLIQAQEISKYYRLGDPGFPFIEGRLEGMVARQVEYTRGAGS